MTLASRAIKGKKFHHHLLELYKREKFHYPTPGASANEMTLASRAIKEKNSIILLSLGAPANEDGVSRNSKGKISPSSLRAL